jgi:hypothetical protein
MLKRPRGKDEKKSKDDELAEAELEAEGLAEALAAVDNATSGSSKDPKKEDKSEKKEEKPEKKEEKPEEEEEKPEKEKKEKQKKRRGKATDWYNR